MANLVNTAFQIALLAILAWVILSWIQTPSDHPLRRVQHFLDRIILPVLRPIQKVIPPLRIGGGALDLSPIVLIVLLQLLRRPVVQLVASIF